MATQIQSMPAEVPVKEIKTSFADAPVNKDVLSKASDNLNELIKTYLEKYPLDETNAFANAPDPLKSQCYFL